MSRVLLFSLAVSCSFLFACDDKEKVEDKPSGLQIKGEGGSINIGPDGIKVDGKDGKVEIGGPGGIKVEGQDGKVEIKGENGKLTIEATENKKDDEE